MTSLQERLRGGLGVGLKMRKEAADELDRLQAENEALREACRMVLMLKQLGGMLPGTHQVVQTVVDLAEIALKREDAAMKKQKP